MRPSVANRLDVGIRLLHLVRSNVRKVVGSRVQRQCDRRMIVHKATAPASMMTASRALGDVHESNGMDNSYTFQAFLESILYLPFQGPLVVFSVVAIAISFWKFFRAPQTSLRTFIVLALLPVLFCGFHLFIRYSNAARHIAGLRKGGAGWSHVQVEADGGVANVPLTKAESNELADTWSRYPGPGSPYPAPDEIAATLFVIGVLLIPPIVKCRGQQCQRDQRSVIIPK